MVYDSRLLRFTFAVSLLFHGAILLRSHNMNPFSPPPKKQKIEVRYIKDRPLPKLLNKTSVNPARQELFPKTDPLLKLDAKVVAAADRTPPPYVKMGDIFKTRKDIPADNSAGLARPSFNASSPIAIKKKIFLPPIDMSKIKNPSYISYYQIVREKIRRSAYQNYTHNETGEAYLSFIISNDGLIKSVRLIEEKTSSGDYLKSIALRSVKDASPFPNFPKELDYQQLSFNIIISFQIE